jgi:hypothetical protein
VRNTTLVGETSEAAILAAFVKAGFTVLLPFGGSKRYDMAVEVSGGVLRVQCKTASPCRGGGTLRFNVRSNDHGRAGHGYRDQADLFAVFAPCTGKVYVVPVDAVGETAVHWQLQPTTANNQHGVRLADDYLLETWASSSP